MKAFQLSTASLSLNLLGHRHLQYQVSCDLKDSEMNRGDLSF